MDPQAQFCHNTACVASGQIGKGNIKVHSRKEKRYICNVCGKTFSETKDTVFYRRRKDDAAIVMVVTLLAYGCPPAAIVAALGWDERTVYRLQQAAGEHAQAVHEHLVEQPRDLEHVQADEIWVKAQGVILWLAMAMQVGTRLWLGAEVSTRRDGKLVARLMHHVRACALCRPLLICVDGFAGYVKAIRNTFREPLTTGKPGRPRLRPWDGIHIAQVVKQYTGKRVSGVVQRLVQGTWESVHRLLQQSRGGRKINTAFIERLNGTFRARLAPLVRRSRARLRQEPRLHAAVYLVGTIYNFCAYHRSLRLELLIPGQGRRWLRRTPAIAAGITDHLWAVEELLWYKVPKPPDLPKRRGRPSKAWLAQLSRWGLNHG
jgi:transposase-like protein